MSISLHPDNWNIQYNNSSQWDVWYIIARHKPYGKDNDNDNDKDYGLEECVTSI
jgi:hypothetical protein